MSLLLLDHLILRDIGLILIVDIHASGNEVIDVVDSIVGVTDPGVDVLVVIVVVLLLTGSGACERAWEVVLAALEKASELGTETLRAKIAAQNAHSQPKLLAQLASNPSTRFLNSSLCDVQALTFGPPRGSPGRPSAAAPPAVPRAAFDAPLLG